jgi:hypothetical protein
MEFDIFVGGINLELNWIEIIEFEKLLKSKRD